MGRFVRGFGVFAFALLSPGGAHALGAEVSSDTAAQFYDVRSPTGETVLMRRRLTTTLGVAAYDILDRPTTDPLAPELTFRARLRYDADYGARGGEVDESNFDLFVPGYDRGLVDLMYAYVEGRRFLKGWLGFKLGRQYMVDALGWWSFDGGLARVTTPFYLAIEAYGGLEQRGGFPLSTPRFERDGVWRGSRSDFDPSLYPSFQKNALAPAYGFAVESTGFPWLHGKLVYRRVHNTGDSNVSQFAPALTTPILYDGTRISSDRIGYALDGTIASVGGFKGGIAYDLHLGQVATAFASIDGYLTRRLTLSVDYDYYQPTYDADSIWNFFAGEPLNDLGLRASWDVTEKLSVSASGRARIYSIRTERDSTFSSPNLPRDPDINYYPSNGAPFDHGENLNARYRWGAGLLGLRGSGNFGDGGQRVGGDAYGERLIENRFIVSGRAGLWHWEDKLRPGRDAVSVGYVAGLGYAFGPRARTMFEWQHDMNRLVGHRFRAMVWLSIAVGK